MARNTFARHRTAFLRDTEPTGGGGTSTGDGSTGGDGQQQQQSPPQGSGPAEAVDGEGKGLGFPAETPVEQMSDRQVAAYWRNQTKVQQRINKGMSDYEQNKADAEAYRALQQQQQTPSEQAINAAREETRAQVRKEMAGESAMSAIRVTLSSRGKSEAELDGLLGFLSPDRFVTTDGKVDHQKVTAYADSIAPAGSSQGGGGFGQGRYEQPTQSRSAAGKAEAERRYGKKS